MLAEQIFRRLRRADDVQRPLFDLALADEEEEVFDDLLAPQGVVRDDAKVGQVGVGVRPDFSLRGPFKFFREEVRVAHDGLEGVVQLMGDAGNQLAHGRQFLGADELLLHPLGFRHVADDERPFLVHPEISLGSPPGNGQVHDLPRFGGPLHGVVAQGALRHGPGDHGLTVIRLLRREKGQEGLSHHLLLRVAEGGLGAPVPRDDP
jgi:hypothetical protein